MALKERKLETLEWTEKGKCVGGYLLGVTRNKFKDGSIGITYIVKRTDDSRVVFKGNTFLNLALSPADVGLFIQVEYLGEDERRDMKEGMNRPKLFKVSVDDQRSMKPNPAAAQDYTDQGITDEDIPF